MDNEVQETSKITRRAFLGGGAAIGGAAALTAALASDGPVLRGLQRTASAASQAVAGEERVVSTYCPPNCGGRCRLMFTVRDGRVVNVEAGEMPDPRYTAICVRGLTWPQRIYSPYRMKYPMKRVGERGEGKFVRISWDEALSTIAAKIKETNDKYGPGSVSLDYGRLNTLVSGNSMQAYFAANNRSTGIDLAITIGEAMVFGKLPGQGYMKGSVFSADFSVNEWADRPNTRLQVLIGNNSAHTTMTGFRAVLDGRAAGSKLVVVDPVYTATGIHADKWIRPRHGSDVALLMGVLNVLIQDGLVDTEAALKYSTGPLLVRLDTKKYLREADVVAGGSDKKFMVWSEPNKAAVVDGQASSPALAGSYTVNGIACKTAYQLLKERAAEYTLEKVQQITSVPPEDVRELAHMIGTIKPAMIGFGWGIDQSLYGSDATRVGSVLAVLTDNWGKPGAGIGFHSHATGFRDISPCWGAGLPGGMVALPATAKAVNDPKIPIRTALIARDPMNNRLCDLNFYKQYVKGLDFSVNVEQYFGTTSLWCDMVLPACTFTESPTDLAALISARNGLLLQQKVIAPLWESKPDWQIEKELADRLGFGDYYKHTPDTQIQDQLAAVKEPEFQGITLEKLLAAGGALPINVPSTPNISRERFRETEKFPTDSGRAELYSEKLLPLGQELPIYKDDYEASTTNPLANKYPLVFTTRHHVQRCHSQFFDSAWLLEIWPEPFLELNPVDAAARGLKMGDYAEAFNDRGRAVARVVVTSDYPPGQCNIHHGWKQQQYKAGHHQELTNPRINPAHVLMGYAGNLSFQDNRVEVRKVSM